MTGSSSPCGACKFLRRKCVRGCVFAPYFCHEQGAAHFAAIHKVFGASNVSKLLAHLPVTDRSEAAVTISYEAQARLQDPIYGCVSHIFALQQQVVNLQAQLASLKEQAAQSTINANPNDDRKFYGESQNFTDQDVQSWVQNNQGTKLPQFDANYNFENCNNIGPNVPYCASGTMDYYNMNTSSVKYENSSCFPEDNASFGSMDDSIEMQYSNDHESGQWQFQDDVADDDDLRSMALRYINHHS
ncbi:LOB domain-containing protein 29 [Phtheirospermum japonicum]|uniref:LOB domain-containing protein 29 n=1 Tax=Phtheirospermum japonicum TaxID=374723 RepID=A0A830CLV7_9LAMI|nr:LOB domain-containing protein 29 [Phtheirospermum japonicum]